MVHGSALRRIAFTALAAVALAMAAAVASHADSHAMPTGNDWNGVGGVEEILVRTANEDGSVRETTIWLVVVEGQPYIRAGGSSTWGDNALRDPEIELVIEGDVRPVRADHVTGDAEQERVNAAYREKYGWSDRIIGLVRGGARIFRVVER